MFLEIEHVEGTANRQTDKNKQANKPQFPQLVQKFSKWYGA
jgi:hypothetical protein